MEEKLKQYEEFMREILSVKSFSEGDLEQVCIQMFGLISKLRKKADRLLNTPILAIENKAKLIEHD